MSHKHQQNEGKKGSSSSLFATLDDAIEYADRSPTSPLLNATTGEPEHSPPIPMQMTSNTSTTTTTATTTTTTTTSTSNHGSPSNSTTTANLCVECSDHAVVLSCVQCQEDLCQVCFYALHRKGKRATHTPQYYVTPPPQKAHAPPERTDPQTKKTKVGDDSSDEEDMAGVQLTGAINTPITSLNLVTGPSSPSEMGAWFTERSKYIPLRLTLKERKLMRLIEASAHVSTYTDKVDSPALTTKPKRVATQLTEICGVLSGLVVASDHNAGGALVESREFQAHAAFFQTLFEVARRYKVMNPERMRSEYGKLVYMLQDSMTPEVQELLKFKTVVPVKTVYSLLQERGGLNVLQDQYIYTATKEIIPDGKNRYEINREIKDKEKAIKYISQKYAKSNLLKEEIETCLYAIGDNHSFLRGNRDSVDKMIGYLLKYFSADNMEEGFSLAITGGCNGSRLTHNHAKQWHYVLQSMILWREVLHDMFKLWYLAEEDLLSENNPYQLKDTGQGFHRVQNAPRVGKTMNSILHSTQAKVGFSNWVGSSVIHLGDHNVPNSLMFIDKYTQVSRILNPIVITLGQLEQLAKASEVNDYFTKAFNGIENLRKTILADFFRSAFDGSGADNFIDAGSCIDGRLTSAWHWCSQIEKKPFFPVFLLAGFVGFDGEF